MMVLLLTSVRIWLDHPGCRRATGVRHRDCVLLRLLLVVAQDMILELVAKLGRWQARANYSASGVTAFVHVGTSNRERLWLMGGCLDASDFWF